MLGPEEPLPVPGALDVAKAVEPKLEVEVDAGEAGVDDGPEALVLDEAEPTELDEEPEAETEGAVVTELL